MGCNCLELSYYRVQVSPLVTQTTENSCKVKKKTKKNTWTLSKKKVVFYKIVELIYRSSKH